MSNNKILLGLFEKQFLNEALDILQKALFDLGIRSIIDHNEVVDKALTDIGMSYYEKVPKIF